ncbi:hypothetical protein [Streptomyces sp. NPDC004008]
MTERFGWQAQDWLFAETVRLLACMRQFGTSEALIRAIDLPWAVVDLSESGADAREYEAVAIALRDAVRSCQDRQTEGRASVVTSMGNRLDQIEELADAR